VVKTTRFAVVVVEVSSEKIHNFCLSLTHFLLQLDLFSVLVFVMDILEKTENQKGIHQGQHQIDTHQSLLSKFFLQSTLELESKSQKAFD
jgi:hypothetical protein